MISHPCFNCEPWAVSESHLDLSVLAHSESILALSNGHIGLRGNLEEGEPHGLPGTYLNSFYETRPLPYAGGRLRLPGGRAGRGERHQRQDHPAARRRRAVRRPLRGAAKARTQARVPNRAPAPGGGVGLAGRAGGSDHVGAARLARAPVRCGDPVRGRAARRAGQVRGPVGAGRERAAARGGGEGSSCRGRCRRGAPIGVLLAPRQNGWCSFTGQRRANCGWPPEWII